MCFFSFFCSYGTEGLKFKMVEQVSVPHTHPMLIVCISNR